MSRLLPALDSGRPVIMGILNVTPDSFSDGGRFLDTAPAVDHAFQMINDGADIIDIGGESTRPGAPPVSADEEISRVLPVIERLRSSSDIPISLDSSKPEVMSAALPYIDLVNDVKALQVPGALKLMAQCNLPICLMHMQGEPGTMQTAPKYDDVIQEVRTFLLSRVAACEAAGVSKDRLLLDIGFGFGKTAEHNLTLLNHLDRFKDLEMPLLVGLSRKSTIGKIVDDRLIGSIAGGLLALERGARILRVHDVAETVAAVRVWQAVSGETLNPGGSRL